MQNRSQLGMGLFMFSVAIIGVLHDLPRAFATESTLLGCWRSQQVQLTFAGRPPRDQNGDCVVEYDSTRVHSRCRNDKAVTDNVSAVELTSPGHMRLMPLDSGTGKASPPIEMDYQLDEGWLITTRKLDGPAHDLDKPERFTALSVRVDTTREPCEPHGDTGLRVGRTPVSSLALSVPRGWEPWLIDAAVDQRIASAVNTSFLVGAFVPKGVAKIAGRPASWLVVLDDVRYGPAPVRAAEFVKVKQRFAREIGEAKSTCDQPDRACALLHLREGGAVYTEVVHVRGRVAMISGATGVNGHEEDLRRNVQTFVQQLRRDNP